MTPTESDGFDLIHNQPEFMLAVIAALMNKTGQTHIHVTSADVMAATTTSGLRLISKSPTQLDVYLVSQPSERHVGLDYAEPVISPDVKN